jgi:hypothetical protein
MNRIQFSIPVLMLSWLGGPTSISAQSDMRGHWTGDLETSNATLSLEVDLDKTATGWVGSVSIPAQKASGLPLDAISFSEGKGSFRIKGAPGDPTFTGTLSADGKTLQGEFSQGPTTLPLKLSRTGDAKVEVAQASPPVAAEFLGRWEGTLEAGGGKLRLILTISNGKAGSEAVLVSVDQGNAEIPVSTITQTGTKLVLKVNAVGGGYEGEINGEGTQLTGSWTQLGNTLPLTLKKAAPASPKP